ncbi:MAG: response regulator [Acidobacteria bacterium]|jgi:two-component system OmpR family response regulator|nr:response regulator [Acidobacteriota bacterium]
MEEKNTILIVDDEGDIRLLLQEFLEKNGFAVQVAEDGHKALQLAAENLPDLVITDLLLPKEHGIDVIQTIKDRFLLPVIAISGIYKKEEIRERIGDVFIDDFFEKPLDLAALLASVRSILNG